MREKLIELVAEKDMECNYMDCCKCEYFKTKRCKASMIADNLIANGVTFATDNNVGDKWISVKDRLPDKNGEYLCRHTDKSVHSAEYESIYGSFGYWFDFWEDEYKEWIAYEGVTHWMPLPEPPKEEKDG